MDLPFVRQFPANEMFPKGRRALTTVEVSDELHHLGQKFIALGGAFVCEILPNGYARIAACLPDGKGGQRDVEEDACENGPPLLEAVARLVRASVKHVETAG